MKISKADLKKLVADKIGRMIAVVPYQGATAVIESVVSPQMLAEFLVENGIISAETEKA